MKAKERGSGFLGSSSLEELTPDERFPILYEQLRERLGLPGRPKGRRREGAE